MNRKILTILVILILIIVGAMFLYNHYSEWRQTIIDESSEFYTDSVSMAVNYSIRTGNEAEIYFIAQGGDLLDENRYDPYAQFDFDSESKFLYWSDIKNDIPKASVLFKGANVKDNRFVYSGKSKAYFSATSNCFGRAPFIQELSIEQVSCEIKFDMIDKKEYEEKKYVVRDYLPNELWKKSFDGIKKDNGEIERFGKISFFEYLAMNPFGYMDKAVKLLEERQERLINFYNENQGEDFDISQEFNEIFNYLEDKNMYLTIIDESFELEKKIVILLDEKNSQKDITIDYYAIEDFAEAYLQDNEIIITVSEKQTENTIAEDIEKDLGIYYNSNPTRHIKAEITYDDWIEAYEIKIKRG